ncbi:response regulator transcription factor [bacterium]|nr:response regulator transcription factor [bacterium]
MSKKKILIIDDEENILKLIRYNLAKEGYLVEGVTSGEEALNKIRLNRPDLIVLDLMLPGLDGFDICRLLKSDGNTSLIPIIILTAKGEDADVVTGLELGADDYITKPFSPKVLTARIRAALRRGKLKDTEDKSIVSIHDMVIHPARHEVLVNKKPVYLTATEFDILYLLGRKPGWVFSRDQIISSVKGADHPVTDRSVDVQVVGLRKKLGNAGRFIETLRGVGYRMKGTED